MTRSNNDCREDPPVQRRLQLLEYEGYRRLMDVMETETPLHGKCNFPTLNVTPRDLVQKVRTKLNEEGIKVKDIRLNGSAATHVLSREEGHSYKDLDLIFTVDLSKYDEDPRPKNYNSRHASKPNRPKRQRSASENNNSSRKERPVGLELPGRMGDFFDQDIDDIEAHKIGLDDDTDDVTDSGYTSSGSSVSSYPISPTTNWPFQATLRHRTHSVESSSSIASVSSAGNGSCSWKPTRLSGKGENGTRGSNCITTTRSSKEECWKRIKNTVITILTELLPSEMRGNTDAVSDSYVQKMVKVNNEQDTWSLFSLNNNTGKNLELKFVENMQRQYEFSVDSFQIILDSYIGFKMVNRNSDIHLSTDFYPSILAECVYGDFEAALRHLHHKRICTHRPEEIRGGGLLRYCNLLARDYTPGEVPALKMTTMKGQVDASRRHEADVYFSGAKDVERLEQLMCSRFFIDFSDFQIQQKKLSSYLDNHFVNEDELKFNYLLTLRRVVDQNTVCLMMHERSLIINYITNLARQTLANNIDNNRSKVGGLAAYQPNQPTTVPGYYETPPQTFAPKSDYQTSQLTSAEQYTLYPVTTNTVHSYNAPICTDSVDNPMAPYYQPQQAYPQCTGVATCNHCGSKQVFLDPTGTENYNSNNNNNYNQCYGYSQPPVYVYYQEPYGNESQYPYPNQGNESQYQVSTSTNFSFNNDAPVCPVVYCSPTTQLYFTPSAEPSTPSA